MATGKIAELFPKMLIIVVLTQVCSLVDNILGLVMVGFSLVGPVESTFGAQKNGMAWLIKRKAIISASILN